MGVVVSFVWFFFNLFRLTLIAPIQGAEISANQTKRKAR